MFHRLQSDEQWFHLEGSRLAVHTLSSSGKYQKLLLGKNLTSGEQPFAVVHRGIWFGASVEADHSFTLAACVVAPGFDFEDFESARRDELIKTFPQHKEIIEKLTQ